jgi:protein-tyrosine kinase
VQGVDGRPAGILRSTRLEKDQSMQQQLTMESPGALSPPGALSREASSPAVTFALSREVVVRSLPHSATAESIHALRTHLVARHLAGGARSLAVCETEHSGGTFLATNLAISLADSGVRTLLIDTNIREPELDGLIQPSRALPGLADTIEQVDAPIGFAMQTVLPNLSLLYAGAPRESALELLGSARFAKIIDLCMREFDFTIAATAPANRFADGRRIASVLRHAVVIARKNVTFTQDITTLIQELTSDNVNVIGTVFKSF